jgi:Ca2+-binding EF-hand superfamily protein
MLDQNDDGLLQTTEVQAHFAELDANGDGNLSGDELPRHGRRERGHHRMAVGMALRAADTDDDRNVTGSEWSAFLATVDANGDGQVSFDEVHAQANPDFEPPSLTLDQVNEIFTSLDANGDGTVSEDELPERRRDRGPRGRRGPRGDGG